MKEAPTTLVLAAAVRDALACRRPDADALALRGGRVLAAGPRATIQRDHGPFHRTIDLPDRLVLPAMVNPHAHLDLTDLGPRPYAGDFPAWLRQVAADRPTGDASIEAAVHRGVRMSLEAGVGFLGDVAYWPAAIRARRTAPLQLPGVSYLEVFGVGEAQARAIDAAEAKLAELEFETPVSPTPGGATGAEPRGVVVGLSPHAPYTAGAKVFAWAVKHSESRAYRLTTHAAETLAELQVLRDGSGPMADHLRHYGVGERDIATLATGMHPLDVLRKFLRRGRFLLAHCNHVEDRHFALLRRARVSVAYCPIASAYFGEPAPPPGSRRGGHRYREMLEAGVNVCLATDSIVCQPPGERQPMGLLPQMRFLHRRDGADPALLLAMATVNGLRALVLDERLASFTMGAPANLVAVRVNPDDDADPLLQAMRSDEPAEMVEV